MAPVAADLVHMHFDDFGKREEDRIRHKRLTLPGPLMFFRGGGSRLPMPTESVVLVAHSG